VFATQPSEHFLSPVAHSPLSSNLTKVFSRSPQNFMATPGFYSHLLSETSFSSGTNLQSEWNGQ
jgi:hypothetical protein